MAHPAPARREDRIWDPLVRLTHWGIAAAVLLNALLVEGGAQLHVWLGYAAFALLALRLGWGFLGPEEARFSAFPPSLGAARGHLAEIRVGRPGAYRSHDPLGALMAYALWATLVAVAATGLALEADPFPVGRESGYTGEAFDDGGAEADEDRGEGREVIEEIHEAAADLLLALAAVHVAGVAFESRRRGRNLVRDMIGSGRR